MTYLEAYNQDDGVRWRNLINALHIRDRIIEKKNQAEWATSDLYPHPLKKIESKPKKRNIVKLILGYLP